MKNRSYSALKVLVLCFLVVSVLLPLLSLFTHMTFEDMQKVVANDGFSTMLINSVSLTLASTLISVLLAFVLAWMIIAVIFVIKRCFHYFLHYRC